MSVEESPHLHESLPWRLARSAGATLIFIVAVVIAGGLDDIVKTFKPFAGLKPFATEIRWGLALVALVAGVIAIRGWLGLIFYRLDRQASVILRNVGSWALYACLVLAILTLLGVNLSGLLVGGAIVGVIVGSAAQSSLGNFFAGILLMVSHPFEIGANLRVRSPIAGVIELEGVVVDNNALFTTLRNFRGELLQIPNQVLMNSALTVGKPPLQSSLQVTLRAGVSPTMLKDRIIAGLNDPRAEVAVWALNAGPSGMEVGVTVVLCQVEVRSRFPIDSVALMQAVTEVAQLRP